MGRGLPGLISNHIMVCLLSVKKQTRSKTNEEKIIFFTFLFGLHVFVILLTTSVKQFLNQITVKEQGLMIKFSPQ